MNTHRTWLRLLVTCIGVASPAVSYGQEAVFVLRHGERLEYESRDGLLSEAGVARAQRLVHLLKDAGVAAIYTSEYKRTIQTAQPLAAALKLRITSIGGGTAEEEVKATVAHVRRQEGVVVIVGHGTTVMMLLRAFGLDREIGVEAEHDDLFVVVPRSGRPPALLRLNY